VTNTVNYYIKADVYNEVSQRIIKVKSGFYRKMKISGYWKLNEIVKVK